MSVQTHGSRYQGKRGLWDEVKLKKAVNAVLAYGMSKKRAAREYGIPRPTLIRHIAIAQQGEGVQKRLGRPQVLNESEEMELSTLIQDMESRLFGLTEADVKKIVYSYCCKRNIKHPFNEKDKAAGRVWMKGFMTRHRELSLRKPQAVSIQRAIGFNVDKVNKFYDLLEETVYKPEGGRKIPAANIYNVDETGFTVVQKPGRVLAAKGKKYVGSLTSAEKGRTITAVCCTSATGNYVPPMLVFPRVRMVARLMDHCVPGAVGTCTKTGWINDKIFGEWFTHFLKNVQPQTKQEPVLLLLDGHSSHTRNLEVIERARENNVILLCLPSHTSHRLQPLDVALFRSMKAKYNDAVRLWLRDHIGRKVGEEQVAELFGIAYQDAASVKNAVSGFRKAGIEPFDRHIYSEADYAAALMTHKPDPSEATAATADENVNVDDVNEANASSVRSDEPSVLNDINTEPLPTASSQKDGESDDFGVSGDAPDLNPADKEHNNSSIRENDADSNNVEAASVSFQEFVSSVKTDLLPTTSGRKRKVAHAELLTASPYKRNLEASRAEIEKREQKSHARTHRSKKRISYAKDKEEKQCEEKPKKRQNKKQQTVRRRGKSSASNDDTPCSTCGQRFCDDSSGSEWIQCQQCERWFHNACQGLPDTPQRTFLCIECCD